MNTPTIAILVLLACGIFFALRRVRKGGTCSCGDCACNCPGCAKRR